jgi:beta-phosphoglucomutase
MNLWPRAVLFDFDGVIVNSEPLHFFAFQEVLKGEQIELSEEEYYSELLGLDDRGGFRHMFEKHGRPLDPKTFLRVMTRKKEMMMRQIQSRKYAALPHVEEFVRALWRNYPLAICSGALRDEIEAMLEGVALRDCYSVIVSAEDVEKGKPDPEGYLLTTKLISEKIRKRLEPSDCLVIEDAPSVVETVRQAGFPVLGLTTSHSAEKMNGANWVSASLDPEEIQKLIPGLRMTR